MNVRALVATVVTVGAVWFFSPAGALGQAEPPYDPDILPAENYTPPLPFNAAEKAGNLGAAQISSPIGVPPGRRGAAPQLSLEYNSGGGNGLLGMGWRLSLPAIQRSTRNGLSYQGTVFEHDGEELVPRTDWGSGYYGAQRESAFSKYRMTSPGKGWVVTDREGLTYYFGSAAASQVNNSSGVFQWCLDRVEDPNGNFYSITYSKDKGQIYPSGIKYTGHKKAKPTHAIGFTYENRPDPVWSYRSQFPVVTAKRLKSITTKANTKVARTYTFTYENISSGRSRLKKITAPPLPPAEFTYQDGGLGTFAVSKKSTASTGHNASGFVFEGHCDFDGYPDLIKFNWSTTPYVHVYASDGQGGVLSSPVTTKLAGGVNEAGYLFVADVDTDGVVDILKFDVKGPIYMHRGLGNGGFSSAVTSTTGGLNEKGRLLFGDVLGRDGRLELVSAYRSEVTVYVLQPNGQFVAGGRTNLGVNVDSGRLLVMDCNGDRQDDLVLISSSLWAGVTVFLSRGDGTFAAGIPSELGNGPNETGRILTADFNGDGLLDLLKLRSLSSSAYVHFSMGDGAFAPGIETDLGGAALETGRIVIGDVDKDGLPDIIRHYFNSAAVDCYRSKGDGSFRSGVRTPNTSGALYKGFVAAVNLDGNGGADLIRRDMSGNVFSYLSSPRVPDLLIRATNGLGATYTFDYRSSAGYSNHYLPFLVETLAASSVSDGNGTTAVRDYDYEGGAYDPEEAEFRGFERIEQTLPDLTIQETHFHQDHYLRGKEHQVRHTDPRGYLLTQTTLDWSDEELRGDARFLKLNGRREERFYNPMVFTEDLYRYHPGHGKLIETTRFGTGTEAVRAIHTYLNCGFWNWKLDSEIVEGMESGIVRKTFFAYDPSGNKTREERWGDGGVHPATLWSYDAYGNPISKTDPNGNRTFYAYEPKTYAYANKITLPKTGQIDHVWTVGGFDYRVGKATEIMDENGNITAFQYDAVGRLLRTDLPDGGRRVFTYTDSPHPATVKTVELASPGPPESTITSLDYFDGLGRKIRTLTYGEKGRPIHSRNFYDAMGRLWKKEGPYFSTGQPGGYPWEETVFDYWDRPLTIKRPDGPDGAVATTSIEYSGSSETRTDPDGARKTITKDFRERILQAVEYNGATAVTTSYDYSAADELLRIGHQSGMTTEFSYDSLGKLREMRDPDMGRWQYAYDANGNLVSQTDNAGRVMTLTYDALDRLLSKRYSTTSAVVTYTYDNAADPNGKGRLHTIKNPQTTVTTGGYDEMGRVLSESRTFSGNATVYTTDYEFDAAGRLLKMIYPVDGFRVVYVYHPGTRLTQNVSGPAGEVYAELEGYTADGKLGYIYHGNNAATTITYEPRTGRLTGLRVQGPLQQAASDIVRKTYAYTPAGDIRQIRDELRSLTRNYDYDELHRLISETTPGAGLVHPSRVVRMTYGYEGEGPFHAPKEVSVRGKTHALKYDANGNLISAPALTNPDAPGARSLIYTFENMPVRIDQPGAAVPKVTFTYDGDNRRATKISSQGTTYYIGRHFEVVKGALTRYIFAGDLRLAKVTSAGAQHFHKDHLMSTVAVSDGAGNTLQAQDFIPFGEERLKSGQRETHYLYTDQELDPETNLYNYKARQYDSYMGQFITPDPYFSPNLAAHLYYSKQLAKDPSLKRTGYDFKPAEYARYFGESQRLNRYAYVQNNPVNFVDPEGLWALMGGLGVRATLPGVGGEVGFMGIVGSEGENIRTQVSAYAEAFVAGGLSLGRGPWGGLWSGDVFEMPCATEIGIDTPFGSLSVLFDLNKMNFGVIIGGPSLGAGAFSKVEPLHVKTEVTIFDKKF